MKLRKGFVSNSSSSSFIVFNDDSIIPKVIQYAKLTKKQKTMLLNQGFIKDIEEDIYLTQFISDGYESDDFDKFYSADNKIEYCEGSHFGPYNEDNYKEISDDVWLLKTDDKLVGED